MCAIFLPHYGDKEASLINIFIFRNVRVLFANEVKFRRIFYAFILNLNLKLKLSFCIFLFFKQKLSRLFWIISEGFLLDFCLQEHYGSGKKKEEKKRGGWFDVQRRFFKKKLVWHAWRICAFQCVFVFGTVRDSRRRKSNFETFQRILAAGF